MKAENLLEKPREIEARTEEELEPAVEVLGNFNEMHMAKTAGYDGIRPNEPQ